MRLCIPRRSAGARRSQAPGVAAWSSLRGASGWVFASVLGLLVVRAAHAALGDRAQLSRQRAKSHRRPGHEAGEVRTPAMRTASAEAVREVKRDGRFERTLVFKELAIIVLIGALVATRLMFVR